MPLQNTTAANAALQNWTSTDKNELCDKYFPNFDSDIIADAVLAMRLYVRDNQHLFMEDTNPGHLA